jgi:glucokinase
MEITSKLQNMDDGIIAGIDIGGTKIAVGLIDDTGKVLVRTDTPIHVERGPQDALNRILEILRAQTQQIGVAIAGIGIGCTGPVDPITGELGDVNTLPGWQGWNPVMLLSAKLGVTAAMENDADAGALGEIILGPGKGKRSLVYITVGTGIGAGVILNGEIYRGANHSHPELGHHIIDPNGPLCTCGAYGCWESFAAGPAMEQWFAEQTGGVVSLNAKEICALARAGDSTALLAVRREAKYLGMGLANIVSALMPEAIVLGGSMMQSADLFLDGLQAVVRGNCRLVPYEFCEISVASLGPDVGLIGASQVWHHRFQKSRIANVA